MFRIREEKGFQIDLWLCRGVIVYIILLSAPAVSWGQCTAGSQDEMGVWMNSAEESPLPTFTCNDGSGGVLPVGTEPGFTMPPWSYEGATVTKWVLHNTWDQFFCFTGPFPRKCWRQNPPYPNERQFEIKTAAFGTLIIYTYIGTSGYNPSEGDFDCDDIPDIADQHPAEAEDGDGNLGNQGCEKSDGK